MVGRMGIPFDRGRLFACLWPPPICFVWLFDVIVLVSRCLVWNFPLEMLMVFGVLCLILKLHGVMMNWMSWFEIKNEKEGTEAKSKASAPSFGCSSLQVDGADCCHDVFLECCHGWACDFGSPCDLD